MVYIVHISFYCMLYILLFKVILTVRYLTKQWWCSDPTCHKIAMVPDEHSRSGRYLRHAHIHTHPFNGSLSGTTQVSRYQKGKTNLDFAGATVSERRWCQLGHMQVCTSLQTDNHAITSLLKFFTGQMLFLPPNQRCQSSEGNWPLFETGYLFQDFRYVHYCW